MNTVQTIQANFGGIPSITILFILSYILKRFHEKSKKNEIA